MQSKIVLSLIFSFKNEESVLPELISRTRKVLDHECPGAYELIFVNDRSTDNSLDILQKEARNHNDIRIINTARPTGVSPCVLLGMEYSRGEAVIYMDADLQDPPELIGELLAEWRAGYDVVHTVRLSRAGESRLKLLVTHIGYKIIKWASSIELPVNAGDFKLLSRRAVNEVIKLKEKKPYMRGLATWVGFNQTQVKYHREARKGGKTKFNVISSSVINNFLDSALISFSDVPLKLFMMFGLFISAGSFLYLPYLAVKWSLGFPVNENFPYIAAFFFLSGVILLGIGVLGLYLSSIFFESKGRPNYIIESTFGFENDIARQSEITPPATPAQSQASGSRLIAQNLRFNLYFDRVGSGEQLVENYLVVEPKGIDRTTLITGVAILPVHRGSFGLLKVFRHPIDADSWEIVRGFVEPDEPMSESARRELKEESNLECHPDELIDLGRVTPDAGIFRASIQLYAAPIKELPEQPFLSNEIGHREFRWIEQKTIEEMISNHQIQDSYTLVAYSRYQLLKSS